MKATTIKPQAVRRAAALLALALAALAANLVAAPSAQAAPLPQFWTTCFSEEGGSGANECDGPGGIAADPDTPGHVYVADSSNNRINEFNAWGAFVKSWGWGVRDGSLEPQTCGPEATPPSASCQKGIAGPRGGQLGRRAASRSTPPATSTSSTSATAASRSSAPTAASCAPGAAGWSAAEPRAPAT